MPINQRVTYRLANKFKNGSFIKDTYEFERKGNAGFGRLSWSISNKKQDGKVEYKNSTAQFVCFGENITFLENNLSKRFTIDGTLSIEKNPNAKEGEPKTFPKFTVFQIELAEEQPNAHQKAKANAYQPDDEELSEIPF